MTSRQIRRAEERRARKLDKNSAPALVPATAEPSSFQEEEETVVSVRTRAEVNRENAQHSTGPNTGEGKAISSKNRLKHGFCGQFIVLASESQEAFDNLLQDLRREHEPATPTENILVDGLAQHYWLNQRAQIMQENAMRTDRQTHEKEKSFALYLRYQSMNARAFSKCLKDLLKLKAERQKQESKESDNITSQRNTQEIVRTARKVIQSPEFTPEPKHSTAAPGLDRAGISPGDRPYGLIHELVFAETIPD